MTILLSVLAAALFIYLLIVGYLYFFQRSIIYVPCHKMKSPIDHHLLHTDEFTLKTPDHEILTTWHVKPTDDEDIPLMLYLHGNAGSLADRVHKLKIFSKHGFNVLCISYRGYGTSTGSPTEQGLYTDARTLLKCANEKFNIPNNKLFIYGESLGSGIAAQMACEHPDLGAIILEAPYQSIAHRGQEKYPFIPVKHLLKDTFDTISKIGDISVPKLIFHGQLDDVMPFHHGKAVFDTASEPKESCFFTDKGHSDFNVDELSEVTKAFVKKHIP